MPTDRPRGMRPVRRRSLVQDVIDQLLELVASGDEPEVGLPSERVLCDELRVSRSVLREALSALHHLGVLEMHGKTKYGSIVAARAQIAARTQSDGQRELIDHPLEVRRMLEPQMAAMAAERASGEALAEVEACLERMEEAARCGERTVDYDSAFHTAIARATGNQTLVQVIRAIVDSIAASRELSLRSPEAVEVALAAHREILDALKRRDAAAARHAMAHHMESVEELIRGLLTEPAQP